MMYEIKGQKQSDATVCVILAAVGDALSRNHGHIESEDDSSIVFTSSFIQFNWNILAPVSRGVVSVQAQDGHSVLSYQVSLFRTRVAATIFTTMGIVMGIAMALSFGKLTVVLPFALMALLLGWGGVYGANYCIAKERLSRFFDQVLKNLPAEPRSPGTAD